MALIGSIRKHYWFLVLIIGISLLLFVLSDFSRKSNKQSTTAGEIAGEKVSITEFNKRVEENIEMQKQNMKRDNFTASETNQIRQGTWQQVVTEILMNKEYEKLGIVVTTDELNDMFRGNNIHPYVQQSFTDPKTGAFDKKQVADFVEHFDEQKPETQQQYLRLEKTIKQERINQKYSNLIAKSFYLPTAFAKRSYEESTKTANLLVAALPYKSINDTTIKLTDADYQKYYDEYKYRFHQDKEVRNLVFVSYPLDPSAEDIAKSTDEVNKLYEEFKMVTDAPAFVGANTDTRYDSTWHRRGDFPMIDSLLFNAPIGEVLKPFSDNKMLRIFKVMDRQSRSDSLRASHILLSFQGAAIQGATRTKEAAEKMADSLMAVINANPAQFEVLASTLSDDQNTKTKQGDLDWFADGAMVGTFNNAVSNGTVGEVKKIETMFGYHIIKITGKTTPILKVRFANIDRQLDASSKTIEGIYNNASALAAENKTIQKLEGAAKTKGLVLRSAEQVDNMASSINGVEQAREIVHWAFNKDTKEGDVSNVFETEGAYVVAAVKNKIEKGDVPLSIIKEYLKPLVLRDKKAEMLMKKASDQIVKSKDITLFAQQVGATGKVDTVSVSFATGNLPNYGHEPKVIGSVFGTKTIGQVSKPQKGEQGVFVYIIEKFNNAPETPNFDALKQQQATFFQSRVNAVSNILEEKADIKDHRFIFF